MVAEEGGGARGFGSSDVFGGALGHNLSTGFTAFRTDIDQVVGLGEDIQVMLDDDDRVT